jgi:hypothetical protein
MEDGRKGLLDSELGVAPDPVRFYAMFVYFLACFIQVRDP